MGLWWVRKLEGHQLSKSIFVFVNTQRRALVGVGWVKSSNSPSGRMSTQSLDKDTDEPHSTGYCPDSLSPMPPASRVELQVMGEPCLQKQMEALWASRVMKSIRIWDLELQWDKHMFFNCQWAESRGKPGAESSKDKTATNSPTEKLTCVCTQNHSIWLSYLQS